MKLAYALMISAALVGGTTAGCAKESGKKPSTEFDNTPALPSAPAASSPEALRDALVASDTSLKVAIVAQADTRSMTASIASAQDGDFKSGDVVSFMDLTQQTIASGVVSDASGSNVTIRYTSLSGGRSPREGDLALKFGK